jgi:hypothetical protein
MDSGAGFVFYSTENKYFICFAPVTACTLGQDVQKSAITSRELGLREQEPEETVW